MTGRPLHRWIFAVAVAVAATWSPCAAAQQVDLDSYAAVDIDDLPEHQQRWLRQEVLWIITDTERDVFLRLESAARRDDFIERFWAVRDPSPGTARNEYRELHYKRLGEAEDRLKLLSTRPVWQTDMGRVYTLLGAPQSRSRLPNTTDAVPIEVWFYNVDPAYGTPPFFYLIFFKDRGIGDYRLYSPAIDGPEKLLNAGAQAQLGRSGGAGGTTPGQTQLGFSRAERAIEALRQVDPELGNAAASLVPGEGGAGGMVSPLRSEMVLSRIFEIPHQLMPRPVWAFRVLTGETEATVRFETLPMLASASVLFDPSGLPFVHFSTRAPGDQLNLNNFEDSYYVTFDVASTLRDRELRVLEDRPTRTLQADLDEEEARRLRGGPMQYIERMPVLSGDYTLEVMLENNLSGQFGRASFDLHVPDLSGDAIDAATPVVAGEAAQLESYEEFAEQYPYQVGDQLFVPTSAGPLPATGTATLYWQVYLPPSRVAPVEVVYQITDTSARLLLERRVRVPVASRDRNGLVGVKTEVDLAGFPVGAHRLRATIEEAPDLRFDLPFHVAADTDYVRPYVHALTQPPALGVESSVARARQLRTLGRTEEAIGILSSVVRRDPGNRAAFDLQVELLGDAGRDTELADLIRPRLVDTPNDPGLLLLMGGVEAKRGQHYDAIRYYERALIAGQPESPDLLNALASEYYAEGDRERTRELIERSLELDAEQPQMRRLLQELLGAQ